MNTEKKNEQNPTEVDMNSIGQSASCEYLENKQVSLIDVGNVLTRIAKIERNGVKSFNIAIGNSMLLTKEEEFDTCEKASRIIKSKIFVLAERMLITTLNQLKKFENESK